MARDDYGGMRVEVYIDNWQEFGAGIWKRERQILK